MFPKNIKPHAPQVFQKIINYTIKNCASLKAISLPYIVLKCR